MENFYNCIYYCRLIDSLEKGAGCVKVKDPAGYNYHLIPLESTKIWNQHVVSDTPCIQTLLNDFLDQSHFRSKAASDHNIELCIIVEQGRVQPSGWEPIPEPAI